MKKIKINYSQYFNGEVLRGSHIRTVKDAAGLKEAVDNLYSDPHVFLVHWEEIHV